ncbi:hypothetical protein NDU88_002316 [Pleurodeles waltl]|uniref:Uncharacterized protein n=1 Tax=Pleurodeles waltl TaxID=8319 RepID=A0AAV7MAM5_PLEWA|nr:hypothetical protein NDU88_002316 [Pleurodeles waltl]
MSRPGKAGLSIPEETARAVPEENVPLMAVQLATTQHFWRRGSAIPCPWALAPLRPRVQRGARAAGGQPNKKKKNKEEQLTEWQP